ncbi:hypothetical protein FA09DRAFT_58713 [Tilletiopsis washingtonensis]|uniref:Uncharacterized protein n=1 Tax=Tilletiopsis washingtonensis TaxID=58919 RepID=A0A316Z604_9BASI|nr:hypothetical protein FA09DRAFT_58713 [Tilletiopsis washingtonensis]PWN97049.1 hypothetical protein FA09DRAFT_58713 [Tilletiopsis washingtonensis]
MHAICPHGPPDAAPERQTRPALGKLRRRRACRCCRCRHATRADRLLRARHPHTADPSDEPRRRRCLPAQRCERARCSSELQQQASSEQDKLSKQRSAHFRRRALCSAAQSASVQRIGSEGSLRTPPQAPLQDAVRRCKDDHGADRSEQITASTSRAAMRASAQKGGGRVQRMHVHSVRSRGCEGVLLRRAPQPHSALLAGAVISPLHQALPLRAAAAAPARCRSSSPTSLLVAGHSAAAVPGCGRA